MNDDGKPQDVSSAAVNEKTTSIVALLEVANTIRKEKSSDHVDSSSDLKDSITIMPGADDAGAVEAGNTESKVGRSAYSAETVAAISSLAAGESPLFYDDVNGNNDDNNTGGEKSTSSVKKAALAKREITLQDRASAVMSVYKDFIKDDDDDDNIGQYENSAEMVTDDDAMIVPFHTVKHRPLNIHEKRKEGHKVAALDKFCKDVEEGNINVNGRNNFDDSDEEDDDDGSSTQGSHYSKSSKKKRYTNHYPTAASTTAAFRLKAEVAIKAAATKTKIVATNAAVAVKTKYKDKTTNPTKLLEKIGSGVENDFDFANYHDVGGGEDARILSNKNRTNEEMEYGIPPTTITNGFQDVQQRKSAKPLPDWKEDADWRENAKETWEKDHDVSEGTLVTQSVLTNNFRPHWFSDAQGWSGTSYEDAKRFCEYIKVAKDQEDTLHLCPLEVYCPHGPLHDKPLYYEMDAYDSEQWAPISGENERWVMIGNKEHHTCTLNPPQVSVDTLSPTVKKHIMCCQGPSDANVAGNENSSPETADDAIASANQLTQLFYEVTAAYRPITYDRSTGWQGQTYQEAVTYCDSYHNYIPCPYEVYCPDQKHLMAGISGEEGESWAPVVNQENEWVQVGTGDVCELYSERYGSKPDWGVSGENSEAITRHIMCCRAHALQDGEEPQHQPHENPSLPPPTAAIEQHDKNSDLDSEILESDVAEELGFDDGDFGGIDELDFDLLEVKLTQHFNPTWFDRETGWRGQTYEESTEFCNKIDGYIPCPHYVYCPADGKKVLGGRKEEGESWAAVVDGFNEWVQVGAGGECNLYSANEGETPGWGLTGDNNEEITRHIMCCKHQQDGEESNVESDTETVVEESVAETADIDDEGTNAEEPESSTMTQNENESSSMSMLEIATQDTFHPEWFGSSLGWFGGTYGEGKAFCESLPQANNGHWYLCPSSAYCPNGPRDKEPLYLQKDAFEGIQWAPISDKQNGWMMVGKMSQQLPHTCEEYFQINHHDPLWGLDGSSTDMKQHILCCNTPSGIYLSKDDEEDNIVPTNGGNPNKPNHDESALLGIFTPRWFSVTDGWNSGSHDDAIAFCEQHDGIHLNGKKMELCPYVAYCPEGPGTQPIDIGGHVDVNKEGQQWAPLFGQANHWVSISGEKACLAHLEVNGAEPSWGLDASNPDVKKHVLCCSPNQ
ncbi:hypothetical protein QTG54_012190 [Skeletonema marinoi]|uniref:DUF7495 domain-containing protein n=1 Tax=Skeletonema marinoi TaxID=267567 RepID=A0AAD9D971_9STRA|nr:hypothetical protein QTG54_012190 [Skeletonema marinoi]